MDRLDNTESQQITTQEIDLALELMGQNDPFAQKLLNEALPFLGSIQRKDGTTKLDHSKRVIKHAENARRLGFFTIQEQVKQHVDEGGINVTENRTLNLSTDFKLGLLLHDLLDIEKEEGGLEFKNKILDILREDTTINTSNSLVLEGNVRVTRGQYILGIINSAEHYEDAGEYWRIYLDQLNLLPERTKYDDKHLMLNLVKEAFKYSNKEEPLSLNTDEGLNELHRILTKKYNSKILPNWIWHFRAPMADIDRMEKNLDDFDIEGLISKTLDVIDNLDKPNPENEVAGWMDAQELLGFYGPLLDAAGLSDFSIEVYSKAFQYLNNKGKRTLRSEEELLNSPEGNEPIIQKAVEIHSLAQREYDNYHYIIDNFFIEKSNKFTNRIKSRGSTSEKFRSREPEEATRVPDSIGYKWIIGEKNTSRMEILDKSLELIDFLTSNTDLQFFHTRNEYLNESKKEPELEITYGEDIGVTDEEIGLLKSYGFELDEISSKKGKMLFRNEYGQLIQLSPQRGSGYNAAHISFTGQVGWEFQITTAADDEENSHGRAAHIFYKAKNALGNLGYQKRSSIANPQDKIIKKHYFILEQNAINKLKKIKNRTKNFIKFGGQETQIREENWMEVQQILYPN